MVGGVMLENPDTEGVGETLNPGAPGWLGL